ncbi:MAG: 2-phosphosulfolactate phosphatase [Gemmatimonadales bacterium]
MTIEVAFTPASLAKDEIAGKTVFVIDVLRATTTVCAALAKGARGVIPVGSIEEATRLAQTLGPADVLLAGERNMLPIPGFALGNSPLEMTETVVQGKTIVMTTTNGTAALLATGGAAEVYLAAAVNLEAASRRARSVVEAGGSILILCAGRAGQFGLDDAYTAGRLVAKLRDGRRLDRLNDAAVAALDLVRRYRDWRRPFELSAAGRGLAAVGLAADVAEAAREDRYPVLPRYRERRIQVLAPEMV